MRKKLLLVLVGCGLAFEAAVYGGPLSSGALWLLLPTAERAVEHDTFSSRKALHKGGVHLGTGLYIRNDEDLIVPGTPALILRRTYLSGYRVPREFGIGATHNGELYLVGDPDRFQWIALILPDGTRIRFERTSPGASYYNAMFEHRSSPSEWQGARLGWVGVGWAIRRADGSVMRFQACARTGRQCSIVEERDRDGHTIHYRRDASGQLVRMAAENRWIAFTYDADKRIVRAAGSAGSNVRYEYDVRGRLARVQASDGTEHRYAYTDGDELSTIADPGIRIENTYGPDGRCIRQVNYIAGSQEPTTFAFAYVVKDGAVMYTDVNHSDGTWRRVGYGPDRYIRSESWAVADSPPLTFTYTRDPLTSVVTMLSLTCWDEAGTPIHNSSPVDGNEAVIKWSLLQATCLDLNGQDELPNSWPQAAGA